MYLHEIGYRGECGRKIHLKSFSTDTDRLISFDQYSTKAIANRLLAQLNKYAVQAGRQADDAAPSKTDLRMT